MRPIFCTTFVLLLFVGCIQTADTPFTELKGHVDAVWAAEISPDGTKIVVSSEDGTICVLDVVSGHVLYTLEGFTGTGWAPCFVSNGTKIIAGALGIARIWDAESGRMLQTIGENTDDFHRHAFFSPDGTKGITAVDNIVEILDIESGTVLHTLEAGVDRIFITFFSPDGTKLVTGDLDSAQIWDVESGIELQKLDGTVSAFSPDGTKIVVTSSGSQDRTRIVDVKSGKVLLTLEGWLVISRNGKRIASIVNDETVRILDADSGKELQKIVGGFFSGISPDGKRILTTSGAVENVEDIYQLTHQIWNVESGKALRKLKGLYYMSSPDGQEIVTKSADNTLRIWDFTSGRQLHTLLHADMLYAAFSSNGKKIVTASKNNTIRIWTLE